MSARTLRVGVIGCGYWGPNVVRNFAREERCEVVAVCDAQMERAARVARDYGVAIATSDQRLMLSHGHIDLIVVATPTLTHYDIAKAAIKAGKHVLVMKPLADSVQRAEELVELARQRGVLLFVDHTFLFTGAVRKMRDLIEAGDLGELYYIDSVRINLGLFQSDVNVLWDLAPHDVSIIDYLLGGVLPKDVTAVGAAHAGSRRENVAYLTLRYGRDLIAHVHVNWLAPAKVRRTIVGGSKRMIVYDDVQPSEKLLVYDKGVTIGPLLSQPEPTPRRRPVPNGNGHNGSHTAAVSGNMRRKMRSGGVDPADLVYAQMVSYRSGDMFAPRLDDREALAVEVEHIVDCIRNGAAPISGGESGLRVVRVLDAAQRSMARSHGTIVVDGHRERAVVGAQLVPAMPVEASGAGLPKASGNAAAALIPTR
jgi:predicted dehydrogenase